MNREDMTIEEKIAVTNKLIQLHCERHTYKQGGFLFWRFIYCEKCGTYRKILRNPELLTQND